MVMGRCSGCGATGSLCRIEKHTPSCPDWLDLFAADPSCALSPREEYVRWQTSGRAEDRAGRVAAAVSGVAERRAAGAGRFSPPDLLDD
jgi:hypothetical protein